MPHDFTGLHDTFFIIAAHQYLLTIYQQMGALINNAVNGAFRINNLLLAYLMNRTHFFTVAVKRYLINADL